MFLIQFQQIQSAQQSSDDIGTHTHTHDVGNHNGFHDFSRMHVYTPKTKGHGAIAQKPLEIIVFLTACELL